MFDIDKMQLYVTKHYKVFLMCDPFFSYNVAWNGNLMSVRHLPKTEVETWFLS